MKKKNKYKVTILVPVFNEIKNLNKLFINLNNIVRNRPYKVFFLDGGSNDGTFQKLLEFQKKNKKIFIFKNKKKTTQHALILGLKKSDTPFIAFLGAHTNYPKNYIDECLKQIKDKNLVGCSGITKFYRSGSLNSELATRVLISKFGTSSHSSRNLTEGYSNILPYPVYNRKIIEKIGSFDKNLDRNQDNNLSKRLIKKGYKLFITNKTHTIYHGPKNLFELIKYAYKYGFGNGRMLFLRKPGLSYYHFVPLLFSINFLFYIFSLYIVIPFQLNFLINLGISLYFIINFFNSIMISVTTKKITYLIISLYFLIFHLSYGFSTILGFLNLKLYSIPYIFRKKI